LLVSLLKKSRRLKRLKFKLKKGKGSVQGFTDAAGVTHLPGDIVDLPASYKGEKWLECLEPEKKVVALPSKVEPAPEAKPEVPLESPKKSKKTR
jgi:hypothetical protein